MPSSQLISVKINTLRPRQNGCYFPDNNSKCIFLILNVWISVKIFVPSGPIKDIPALVQIMAWCRPGHKPLFEPMTFNLLMHMCVTRPQWVLKGPHVVPKRHGFRNTLKVRSLLKSLLPIVLEHFRVVHRTTMVKSMRQTQWFVDTAWYHITSHIGEVWFHHSKVPPWASDIGEWNGMLYE